MRDASESRRIVEKARNLIAQGKRGAAEKVLKAQSLRLVWVSLLTRPLG